MFKFMNGLAPKYLSDKLIRRSNVHSSNTRNKSKLNTPLCKSETGQRSFVYRASTIWNNVPDDVRNILHLNVYIRSFKEVLFKCVYHCYFILHFLDLYMATFYIENI